MYVMIKGGTMSPAQSKQTVLYTKQMEKTLSKGINIQNMQQKLYAIGWVWSVKI